MTRALKVFLLLASIFLFIVVLILVRCLFIFSPRLARMRISSVVHGFGKIFISIMGVKVLITGEKKLLKEHGVFFVSNHLSYVDGVIATSLAPLAFIARADLKSWPVFGLFSVLSNTIFVERFSRVNVQKDADKIYRYLKEGTNVILYPEGTSADGKDLLPFKSSFFMAPLLAQSMIVPLVIKYKEVDSQDIDAINKDLVYWYGEMDFVPHLFRLLSLHEITVEVKVCASVISKAVTGENTSIKRKILSDTCRQVIEAEL
ncbi:MAG: lysophospholipid acyltransferase family protein [Candidatus Omnitrophica bacterium]|nr:lysophospholipid acyltransferase family protein [Candidatus Omnitrophota bacterium]